MPDTHNGVHRVDLVAAPRGRGRLLLFGGAAVAAATGVLDLVTRVQETCRVDRLFVVATEVIDPVTVPVDPARIAVLDIKVGTRSQLTANARISGVAFQADNTAMMQGLGLDTLQAGTQFLVRVDAEQGWTVQFAAFATALR